MDRYADDVVAVLDTLQIERAVIVGLSLGGYVSFALWRRHRDRVRALVLADTRAGGDTVETVARRHELIELAETQGSAAVANAQIAGLVGKTTRDKRPDIYDSVHRMMSQAPETGVVGSLEAMIARPDSTPTLATIDVPTLIIVGDEDVATPPKEARQMHAAIRGSRLEVLRQAGHLSNLERPASFNAVVTEFSRQLDVQTRRHVIAFAIAAEQRTSARVGAVLFRNRSWLPVPFLLVALLAPANPSATLWLVGAVLIVLGEWIRLAGVAAAGTVTRRRSRDVQRLVTYGIFRWVRNPLYVGNFLIWMGFVVISGVIWFVPVP